MPALNRPPTLEWLVEKTRTVYSHPLIYDRLNETINHPRSSIADIARIITEDQGLTARILRLANSPMFGYFGKVDSISRAVTIIGTQQLRDLALAAAIMGVFKGIPEELISMPSFWRHSIACGIIARCVAIYLRENNVERFFVAGILHDVGQLILFTSVPDIARQLLEQSRNNGELYYVTERAVLGFDHAELGGALLRNWKIPANVSDPVTFHHLPQRAEQFPLEAAIIHLADVMCQGFEFGTSGEWSVPPLDSQAWDRIGMPVTMLTTIVKQAEPLIEETFAILAEEP
jgi:HD-like signal output (HDOD) protein